VLIPILYLKGVSTGDFEEALIALLGKDAPGLSASTIGRLKEAWSEEHARWSKRDLSAKNGNQKSSSTGATGTNATSRSKPAADGGVKSGILHDCNRREWQAETRIQRVYGTNRGFLPPRRSGFLGLRHNQG
jgi:hypothetical protein